MKLDIEPDQAAALCRAYRDLTGLTQRQLARIAYTTPGVIGDLERGRVRSWRVVYLIMNAMERDVPGFL